MDAKQFAGFVLGLANQIKRALDTTTGIGTEEYTEKMQENIELTEKGNLKCRR